MVTRDKWGLQRVTRGYNGLQVGYRGLPRVRRVTRCYRG